MRVSARRALVLVALLAGVAPARAGHEFPFYPSFYPHEITIETVDPASAAVRLEKGSLHAYVGGDPFEGKPAPANVGHVESLGAYVVVTLNPARAAGREGRCPDARHAVGALGRDGFTFHPYPVTPFHADFLHHADLARAAAEAYRPADQGPRPRPLRIRAKGPLARTLVPPGARADGEAWDAEVEAVDVAELLASRTVALNGWLGPPWLKEGWFHAYLLQAERLSDAGTRRRVEETRERLVSGRYDGLAQRLNLERALVSLLRAGCERVVAGYTVKRESFNAEYSGGVENVAHDSQAGLTSPVFLRTVKLKDFPWNGWLTVGIATKPTAAWNPMGGFSDPAGRLLWFAVGDPALLPSPQSGSWIPNRVTPTLTGAGDPPDGLAVPEDALIPAPGTGHLLKVGAGNRAAAQVLYRVLTSAFHDGTRMSAGDILYPFSFAYRWGAKGGRPAPDPAVEAATALLRERLAGLRVLRVERDVLAFGDVKLTYEVPVVEVYVNHRSPDPLQVAAVAPPWTSLPWHVIALMEHAVAGGLAAFSEVEARRRGLPWLDLARDRRLQEALLPVVEEFARESYVPEALRGRVTAAEARERWSALRLFYDTHRHFLVTNGPYRLHRWSPSATVLQVFRDLTYPRGVGSFDRFAIPLRAWVAQAEIRGDRLEISAQVERVERFGREHKIVTEPFVKKVAEAEKRTLPVCRYAVIGPDGSVVTAGTAHPTEAGTFHVRLARAPVPGPHTILVALSLDDNHVHPPVTVLPWTP